jgi:hypothetical protein
MRMLHLIDTGEKRELEHLMRVHIGHVRGSWAGRAEQGRT